MDDVIHAQVGPADDFRTVGFESPKYAGAFFPKSKEFTIAGGVFNNITNHFQHGGFPSDFRLIPLGDIDLQHEIRMDAAIVERPRERRCVRRVYSAKLEGRSSGMTVALYQGNNAEEEWRSAVSPHSSLRHPNIVQLYGVVNSSGIHAAVYHDDLIPFEHFLNHYRQSHFLTLDLWAYFVEESDGVAPYFWSVYPGRAFFIHCGTWIRPSTGRLCLDLIPSETPLYPGFMPGIILRSRPAGMSFREPNREATFIASVTLAEYDEHCFWALGRYRRILVSTAAAVILGAALNFSASSQLGLPVELASLSPLLELHHCSWPWIDESLNFAKNDSNPVAECGRGGVPVHGHVMTNGWTRCDTRVGLCLCPSMAVWTVGDHMLPWLSQANHIISRVSDQCDYEDYAIVTQILFQLTISEPSNALPEGYLFLCPAQDFQVGPNLFRWPDCPAYWSLDPSGTNRLTLEDARNAGFPSFDMMTGIQVVSWDESVYAGTRQVHEAKGFNPYSQDVARHLGHPLYQLSNEMGPDERFAHVDDEDLVFITGGEAQQQSDWDTCDRELSD